MRRPTHRHTAATAVTLAALALAVVPAGPAAAGGPTSALVVNGGSGDAAALYATDPGYAALDKAIGDAGERVDPMLGEADLGGADARQITVTWLQHDVHVWRVDTLYPDARGGAVVSRGTGEDVTASPTWRRVEHPERLGSLLDRLGVAERPREQSGWYMPSEFASEGVAPPSEGSTDPAPDAGAAPDAGSAADTAADGDAGTREHETADSGAGPAENWWWTLPGLAAGALLATTATRLRRRPPAAAQGAPRGELLDLND